MAFFACQPDTTDKMFADTVLNYSWLRTDRRKEDGSEEGYRGGEERETLKACQSLLIILIAELKLHAKTQAFPWRTSTNPPIRHTPTNSYFYPCIALETLLAPLPSSPGELSHLLSFLCSLHQRTSILRALLYLYPCSTPITTDSICLCLHSRILPPQPFRSSELD